MVLITYKYSYWGESKPTNITGGGTLYVYTNFTLKMGELKVSTKRFNL